MKEFPMNRGISQATYNRIASEGLNLVGRAGGRRLVDKSRSLTLTQLF